MAATMGLVRTCFVWLVLAVGCGGGGGDGADAAAAPKEGDPCRQAGFTETECPCDGGRLGVRSCTDSLTWSACSCPGADAGCVPGDPTTCRCPGDTVPRKTVCPLDGPVECPCGDAGGS